MNNKDTKAMQKLFEQVYQKQTVDKIIEEGVVELTENDKSAIRDFINNIDWDKTPLNDIKSQITQFITAASINPTDKRKILFTISRLETAHDVARYMYNALLKFEGLGVIGKQRFE